MRALTVGLIGAAALVAGLLIVREVQDPERSHRPTVIPAGESEPATISLERIRARGY